MVAKLLRWSLTVMLALALTPFLAIAQTFTKIAPVPAGVDLLDVWFTSPDDGWVAGRQQTLYRTTDHGLTWTFVSLPDPPRDPGYPLRAVIFVNSQLGFIAGNSGLGGPDIFKTTDGGKTWQRYPAFPFGSWHHIQFVNETTGFMGANGALVRTTDAGENWLLQSSYPDCPIIYGIDFLDENTGLVAGNLFRLRQRGIFKTNDGGQTWQLKHFGSVSRAIFLTDSIALAGDSTSIIRSTDGGETWSAVATVSTGFAGLEKLDSDTVVGVSTMGDVWRSPDGGFTWSRQWSGEADLPGLWRVHFLDPLIGHVAGPAGALLETKDGGVTWIRMNRGIARTWNGIIAFDDLHVILGGDHGYVQSTADAGAHWTPRLLDPPSFGRNTEFSDISVADENTAVVVGHRGGLFKTVDQGATWMNLSSSLNPSYDANAVTFNDANNGWIAGFDYNGGRMRHIRRTYDGGFTWETATLNVPAIDVHFINQTGYVLTTSQLYQTTDGGATWTRKTIPGVTFNKRMSWASADVGYIAGSNFLAKTTDGGDTWSRVRPADINVLYFDVKAIEENEIWACGVDNSQAVVIRSLDGGSKWTTWFLPEQYTTPYRLEVTNSYVYVTGYAGRTWLFDRRGE